VRDEHVPMTAGGAAKVPHRVARPLRDLLRALLAPLTRTRLFRRAGPRILPPVERVFAALSGGRLQLSAVLVPSLVLHTTGAKSGLARDVPLMYTPDGQGRAIVAGTNFAGERHPAWTTNLLAHPDAAITVRGNRMLVHATVIAEDERDAVWARIESQWPGYRAYERESHRTVRLFRLQPVRAHSSAAANTDRPPTA